jgi:type IV secretion system protein VirB1
LIALAMISACAPAHVAPQTIAAIIEVESGGDPLIVHINWPDRSATVVRPRAAADGVKIVNAAIARGASADIGLMQVNSLNLPRLGYSIARAFDACANIKAGAVILSEYYQGAARELAPGQRALAAALSAYNTGNYTSGFSNGYVSLYFGQTQIPASHTQPLNPLTAPTTVFSRNDSDAPRFAQAAGSWSGQ